MPRLRDALYIIRNRFLASLKRHGPSLRIEDGFIENIDVFEAQTRIQGWYTGTAQKIITHGYHIPLKRNICREDVTTARDLCADTPPGFSVCMPLTTRIFVQSEGRKPTDIRLFSTFDCCRGLIVTLGFLLGILVKYPTHILRFILFGNKISAGVLERAFKSAAVPSTPKPIDMSIFYSQPALESPVTDSVVIILPVFNALNLLQECLARVITHTAPPYDLIIVEDCSTDPKVRPWLKAWSAEQGTSVTVLENDKNLGFIGSVNRGLAGATGRHVILLNSDAMVPQGWLPRLMFPILQDPQIASATPLSNNAAILSVPIICRDNPLENGALDLIDATAQKLNGTHPYVGVPTGIGFCMAMNKTFLAKVPELDRRFGKGYGEEVDWCQKSTAIGGRHVAVTNLFVHHVGGESFGGEKQAKLAKNSAVISRLYPRYHQLVQDFINHDPLRSTRLALGIATLDTGGETPIFLTHNMGGGTEKYLRHRIQSGLKTGQGAIVIRDDVASNQYVLELHTAAGVNAGCFTDMSELAELLATLRHRKFIYTCIVGYRNPAAFMQSICAMLDPVKDSLCIQLHDFLPLCPSYNLMDSNNKYCAIPNLETCVKCYANKKVAIGQRPESIQQWRAIWRDVLSHANRVEAFSDSSRIIFERAYPQFKHLVTVIPHQDFQKPGKLVSTAGQAPIVGVLGDIGHCKGAGFLKQAAENIAGHQLIVVGNIDPTYRHPKIRVTGTYKLDDLGQIVAANQINCWLIPSVWPETFSYTTHEVLATGLPVFTFDLGAQAEAVKNAPNGFILSGNPETMMLEIQRKLASISSIKTQALA
ncbi:MAG: glycosyltransferase [Rhodobacteraceae bacterium]|nr:glycosyltransferase [Paracoccaceae bacterium]